MNIKIVIILILLSIGVIGYFLLEPKSHVKILTDEPGNDTAETNPTPYGAPYEASPSPGIQEQIDELITIKPKNAQQFHKDVVYADNCNNTVGVTSYRDNDYKNFMAINNKQLKQTGDAQEGLVQLDGFLNQRTEVVDFERNIDQAFRTYCGGSYNFYLKDLTGINYPGFDKVRVVMSETGQGLFGQVSVLVFAQKGDQFVKLHHQIEDDRLYEPLQKQCSPVGDPNLAGKCFLGKLSNDSNIEQTALKSARELVKLFEI